MEIIEAFGRPYQLGVLVKDLKKAVESYWKNYGIGPWSIYTFKPGPVQDMYVWGERKES